MAIVATFLNACHLALEAFLFVFDAAEYFQLVLAQHRNVALGLIVYHFIVIGRPIKSNKAAIDFFLWRRRRFHDLVWITLTLVDHIIIETAEVHARCIIMKLLLFLFDVVGSLGGRSMGMRRPHDIFAAEVCHGFVF